MGMGTFETQLERLAELERRYDGPIPSRLVEIVLSGDRKNERRIGDTDGAAEARRAIAGRRRQLTAADASCDAWLARLYAALLHHRTRAAQLGR